MARIDYKSIVGKKINTENYGIFTISEYLGKDEKKKHWYSGIFQDTGNEEKVHYQNIIKKNMTDKRLKKLNKQKEVQKNLKERTRLTKKHKSSYNLEGLENKIVLSIDLATKSTGVAMSINGTIKKTGIISNNGSDITTRSHAIVKSIVENIQRLKVDVVIIEDIFLGMNSSVLVRLSEIRGMLLYHLINLGIRYEIIPAIAWKSYYDLGSGRETQKRRSIELYKEYSGKTAGSDDESDAYLILKYALEKRGK